MESYRDVIDAFGGYAAFAAAVDIRPGTASSLRARSSLPPRLWRKTIRAAQERGIPGISFDVLAGIEEREKAA